MAAGEDRKFDAVLGGFLLNELRARAAELCCPESDTLAAYHERSLLPEEMNTWKEHIVGCARCQAILADLETTDSIPVQGTEKEEIFTGVARAAAAAAASISIPSPKEAPPMLPEKSRVKPISRRMRLQWLAPAGALAAGLLIWVAWHENRPQPMTTTEIKTAKLEPPATPPPPVSRDDRQELSADETARVSKDQSEVGGAVSAKPAPKAKSLKQFEKAGSRGRVTRSEAQADKEANARAATALDSVAAANRAQKQPARDDKAGVAGVMSQTEEVQTLTANAQSQNQQAQQNFQVQNQLNEQKASGPNPSRHSDLSKKAKSESPALHRAAATPSAQLPQPAPAPAPAAALEDGAALRMASALSPYVISAPDKKTLWRVGHIGLIEYSSDGGVSWLRQISSVFADLTAGFAPSDKVCWIVGQAGTILLTTDAGAHWVTIHSPLEEDLGGVRATDALHATIWNLANTKTLETSDGGITWKPSASQ